MSAGNARTVMASPPRLPIFGVEIEIYVKLRPQFEGQIADMMRSGPEMIPEHWRQWDLGLRNDYPDDERSKRRALSHRRAVGKAVENCIDNMLGHGNGWRCEAEQGLREWELTVPSDPRKWCMYPWSLPII
jgi:hypothetical protein